MTWVIGVSSVFGRGILLSDVRVSLGDGRRADLLKKVYPIAPCIAAGFAGSVRIGFELLDDLRRQLQLPPDLAGHAWRPEAIANKWPPFAAKMFARAPGSEQKLGCQILMIGVSPNEDLG